MHSFKQAEQAKRDRIKADGLVTLEQLADPRFHAAQDCLMCTICFDMIHDPRECPKCQQQFCHVCIKGAQKYSGNKCPMRCPCPAGGVQSAKAVRDLIDNLVFKCQNNESGCKWQGTQKQHKYHIDKDCEFVEETCSGCKVKLLRKDMDQHHDVCPQVPFECVHCHQLGIKRCELDKHLKDHCPEVYVKCEFCNKKYKRKVFGDHVKKCGSEIISCIHCQYPVARKDMDMHLKQTCLEIKVKCTNEGCLKQISRGDLDVHLQECLLTKIKCNGQCQENILRKDYTTTSSGEHDCVAYLKMELESLNQTAEYLRNLEPYKGDLHKVFCKEKHCEKCPQVLKFLDPTVDYQQNVIQAIQNGFKSLLEMQEDMGMNEAQSKFEETFHVNQIKEEHNNKMPLITDDNFPALC